MGLPAGLRKQAREKVAEVLALAGVSANIYTGRIDSIPANKLPAVNIHTMDDDADITPDEGGYQTHFEIAVFCTASGQDVIQEGDADKLAIEELDTLVDAVSAALVTYRQTLGGLVFRLIYTSSQLSMSPPETEEMRVTRRLNFTARVNHGVR